LDKQIFPSRTGSRNAWNRLQQSQKSAVAEHNKDLSYRILFNITGILAGKNWCMELLIREPAEIELNPNNMN
jgi:hypothetical protein